jgi:putative FmdB family regulatory protein
MPTYEYVCPRGHEFERLQRMNAGRARCPTCGRLATRRISGGAGFIFKGSGFYITDYGKDGKGARTEKETDAAPPATPAKADDAASPSKAEKTEPKAKRSKPKGES